MRLRLFVLLLLFCGLLLFTSCSYAYTWDEFLIYCQAIATQEITTNNDVKNCAQYVLNNKTAILNACTTSMDNFDSFICGKDQSSTYPYLVCANSINVATPGSTSQNGTTRLDGFTTPNFCCKLYSNSISSSQNNKTPINQIYFNAYSVRIGNCMGLTTGSVNNNGWGYFNAMEFYHGPEFTPTYNRIIDIYNNGTLLGQANGVEFGYVYPNTITLGYISNYPVGTWAIEGTFGPSVYYSGDSFITDATRYQFNYTYANGTKNNKLGFDFSSGRVYVTTDVILEKQLYFLSLMFKENSGSDWVDIGPSVAYYPYLYTSPIYSGDYLSPNLNSSIDIDFVNSLDYFINDNENEQYYKDNVLLFGFSGDWFDVSGDFFGLDYRDYSKFGLHSFMKSMFTQLILLFSDFQSVTINMGMLGIWSTDDFNFSFGNFNTVIMIVSNGLLILYSAFTLFRFFNLVSTFDLDTITSSDDVLHFF